jgi:hypothetical protein
MPNDTLLAYWLLSALAQVLNSKAMDDVASAYKGIAKLVKPAPPYHVALDIDMKLLARLSQQQQQQWATLLASVRMLVVGHPLRCGRMQQRHMPNGATSK